MERPRRCVPKSNASSKKPTSNSKMAGFCLLCMPRTLGYCFNPISIFFCDRKDATLAAVVYQVHKHVRERHSYVIRVECQSRALHQR